MARRRVPVRAAAEAVAAALRDVPEGCRVVFHVKPKSKVESLDHSDAGLVLRIAAPPVEGKANDRVIEVWAELASVPRRDVELVRGDTARHKEVLIRGLRAAEVAQRLAAQTS